MAMNLQASTIENDIIKLAPLQESDFERLYAAASDPLIWEQHPNKERYKKEVFTLFFEGAIESKGAFGVIDKGTGELIGTSRYYDYKEVEKSISIGYTFITRAYWGRNYNHSLKTLMLDYAFNHVDAVIFHIGSNNIRSQKAIAKLGATKFHEEPIAYVGELVQNMNFFYKITKGVWAAHHAISK